MSEVVTLIRCPVVLPLGSVTAQQGVPSLALAYLSASLKLANIKTYCLDSLGEGLDNYYQIEKTSLVLNGLTSEEIVKRISPDTTIIGLSCMFSNEWIYTRKIIKEIHDSRPDLKIIIGGEHATADYKVILEEFPFITACVLGEGEETLIELVQKLNSQSSLMNVAGIAFSQDSKIVKTFIRKRIKTIDQIPWPDWEGVPLELYLDRGLGMAAQGLRAMPMLTSRGCPYQCTFCSSKDMWTTSWYARNIEDLVNEIKTSIKKYRVSHFEFYDLTAVVNKKWTQEFCKALIKEDLNITWSLPSGTRSEALDQETLTLLKESGCLKLTYAPESGSERVLKLVKKRANLNKMLSSMKSASKLGIIVKANIIFGFPGSTWSDYLKDFIFLFKMAIKGVHDVTCFCFVPYPGSELYQQLVKNGKIKRDEGYQSFLSYNVYNDVTKMTSWTESLKDWQLPLLTLSGMSFFYSVQFLSRPWRPFIALYRLLKRKPITMFELAIDNILEGIIKGKKVLAGKEKCELKRIETYIPSPVNSEENSLKTVKKSSPLT